MTLVAGLPFTHHHTGLASAVFRKQDAAWVVGEWCLFTDESLLRFEVYVDGINQRVFCNRDTWESLDGPAELQLQQDFMDAYAGREVTEMRFMVTDAGTYGEAARRQAAVEGTATVRAKDRITDLRERADALVVQAASLNARPTEVQLQAFAVRHARISEDMAELERDMARLGGVIRLAGVALVDASSA